jgi:hypothetical protein
LLNPLITLSPRKTDLSIYPFRPSCKNTRQTDLSVSTSCDQISIDGCIRLHLTTDGARRIIYSIVHKRRLIIMISSRSSQQLRVGLGTIVLFLEYLLTSGGGVAYRLACSRPLVINRGGVESRSTYRIIPSKVIHVQMYD